MKGTQNSMKKSLSAFLCILAALTLSLTLASCASGDGNITTIRSNNTYLPQSTTSPTFSTAKPTSDTTTDNLTFPPQTTVSDVTTSTQSPIVTTENKSPVTTKAPTTDPIKPVTTSGTTTTTTTTAAMVTNAPQTTTSGSGGGWGPIKPLT